MQKTMLKVFIPLVGTNLILGLSLLITEATHGISDQDVSMLLVLLVHYMNLPAVSLLHSFDTSPSTIVIVLGGLLQWSIISISIASIHHVLTQKRLPQPDSR